MNYLVPLFDCFIVTDKIVEAYANVKYKLKTDINTRCLVFSKSNPLAFVFDLNVLSPNILKVKFEKDNYFFLFNKGCFYSSFFNFKHKNNEIGISIANKIKLFYNSNLILDKEIQYIEYSHFEASGDLLLIYFTGKRNFLIALDKDEILFADYYDECNASEKEKYFMCKLYDSLNHGKVCKIENGKAESYLAYLDDQDLKLKDEFVALVFLDCLMAGNFKYCNHLLCDDLKLKEEKDVKEFFPDFDFYYPINESQIILIKKNTLAGIYKFEIENCLITNIHNV